MVYLQFQSTQSQKLLLCLKENTCITKFFFFIFLILLLKLLSLKKTFWELVRFVTGQFNWTFENMNYQRQLQSKVPRNQICGIKANALLKKKLCNDTREQIAFFWNNIKFLLLLYTYYKCMNVIQNVISYGTFSLAHTF